MPTGCVLVGLKNSNNNNMIIIIITSSLSLTVFWQKLETFILAFMSRRYYLSCLWLFLPWWS